MADLLRIHAREWLRRAVVVAALVAVSWAVASAALAQEVVEAAVHSNDMHNLRDRVMEGAVAVGILGGAGKVLHWVWALWRERQEAEEAPARKAHERIDALEARVVAVEKQVAPDRALDLLDWRKRTDERIDATEAADRAQGDAIATLKGERADKVEAALAALREHLSGEASQ